MAVVTVHVEIADSGLADKVIAEAKGKMKEEVED